MKVATVLMLLVVAIGVASLGSTSWYAVVLVVALSFGAGILNASGGEG